MENSGREVMTSMVAKPCSTTSHFSETVSCQEKGSRNKRKFRADPPLIEPDRLTPMPQNECTSNQFSAEKFEIAQGHGHLTACDMCGIKKDSPEALKLELGLPCPVGPSNIGSRMPGEEIETTVSFHDADWNDLTESELGELVLNALDTLFKSAIKKIVACGYSEEVVTKALLRSGICHGCKDTLNIVDNTLAFLKNGQEIDEKREPYFEDLQQIEKYILAELICLLKEVRPFFSTGDAMWCLLLCDMNVSLACTMETEHMSSLLDYKASSGTSSPSAIFPLQTNTELDPSKATKPNSSVIVDSCLPKATNKTDQSFQSEAATSSGIPKSKASVAVSEPHPGKEEHDLDVDAVKNILRYAGSGHLPISEEKIVSSRRASGITKREYILRQKSLHLEKHYRSSISKGGSRAGKLGFGGLVLDRKLKVTADSSSVCGRNSFRICQAIGVQAPQHSTNQKISTNVGYPHVKSTDLESESRTSTSSPKPDTKSSKSAKSTTADTELSASLPSKTFSDPSTDSCRFEASRFSNNVIPSEKSVIQWIPQDKKDEIIVKLVSRVQEMQSQLQEWTEWANQKVMQAARRLGKDKAELKALRQEKEEVERLKKEKQVLEENTMKKLTEMENALGKASGQVEKANAAVCRLETENASLRREMEVAKSRAAESAARFQEVSKREKGALMNSQLWEKEKSEYQEELATDRRRYAELQQKLEKEKHHQDQLEGRWKQENEMKEELLAKFNSLKKEKEQVEASAKSKEEVMKSEAENNLHKYKDEIQKLEKEISQFRLKTDSFKIAALKRGLNGSYLSKLTDSTNSPSSRECQMPYITKMVTEFEEDTENVGVRRERECVMCLSEEMSVVFLPCAHQVVCTMCNDLHEKQGMKDCPSCRSPIQQRISVRLARS